MPELPKTGYLRLVQIVGDPTAKPPIPPLFPVSRSTWLNGVRSGRYPQKIRLSKRCVAWRVEDIRNLIKEVGEGEQ